MKEDVNYDPTKTESLKVNLNINDKKDCFGNPVYFIRGSLPWIIDDVEDKIQTVLGTINLTSLDISELECKSLVANEFLDLLCSYDMNEQGLNKLRFDTFKPVCEPFEDEIMSRLANICPRLTHLQFVYMDKLTESGKLSLVSLFRQIIQ